MTVDYSKIDFAKLNEGSDTYRTRRLVDEIHVVAMSGTVAASRTVERGWAIEGRRHAECLMTLASYCAKVDAFITAETARIEAEEEAANWVPVPWQDVEWLDGSGATVKLVTDSGDLVDSADVSERCSYRADRRTFPAGYDTTQPRWVKVKWSEVERLENAGCKVAWWNGKESIWINRSAFNHGEPGKLFSRYAIDAHTLPPGVPLHTDSEPEPRPCTKEFALMHLDESEVRRCTGEDHSEWYPLSENGRSNYEFRTTAKEAPEPSAPRLPTVKLPDGCCWEIIPPLGVCAVDDDGRHRRITQVFASERQRRIDAACEAAFQELYGE